ncbi:putative glutamyl-tRNA amidotransferase subunit A [Saccharata proteae CBS 121410]|uniref:Putative glutamyl-tRNA amidotransferase subunit A n=1 Tax=Saccharata proteae CBS 121410 TaxID=1314787 RepID=A0A6A5YBF5_9PEZI|nr:putative glutamyl-tRNA amidotransferase subunit A [Saccharata proteae CBS 121410]
MGSTPPSWQQIAQKVQAHRDATIAALQPSLDATAIPTDLPRNVTKIAAQVLSPSELSITESTPEKLLSQLATGDLKCTAVTSAFLRRAALAQHLTNCITELLPERASARAQELDDYLAKHGKPMGPLHGLPISVKEHIPMDGLTTNAGFVAWADNVMPQAPILDYLWKAGAVFYARTTQPQTLMHLETSSNLCGVTVNPYNTDLTCGGSSGGEGAIAGMKASVMGIGTDIGGSIRSPAANNGVYGLRPTSYRLPNSGLCATMKGQEQVVPCIGPLSSSLEGIKLFCKTLVESKPWLDNPALTPMEWRDQVDWLAQGKDGKRKLKVAVMKDDGVVKPHPPVLRAIDEVIEKLKGSEDVEIVEWKPYKHDLAWEIIASLYFCDAGNEEKAAINASGEPFRPLTDFILTNNPHVPKKPYSVEDIWRLTVARETYKAEYAKLWKDTATGPDGEGMVDVILCPVGPGAAPPIDQARWWGYTSQWNLLDYPGLVFPVTQVDPAVDKKNETYEPRNADDEFNHKLYEPETYRDAPVSLQLVGRRYDDEKVIQALEFITGKTDLPFVKL